MISQYLTHFAAAGDKCTPAHGGLFGFPTWYEYLDGMKDAADKCTPTLGALSDVWAILAAIIEILLRIAGFAAVIMVVYAGVTYILSQGEPEKTTKAKGTLANALVGLAVAVSASFIVSFVARSIG